MSRWLWIILNALLLLAVLAMIPITQQKYRPIKENNRAVELLRQGKHEEAITLLKGALESRPKDSDIRENLRVAYQNHAVELTSAGKELEAMKYFEQALALKPDEEPVIRSMVTTLNNLAVEKSNQKNFPESQKLFEQASEMLPRLKNTQARDEIRNNYASLLTLWGVELMKRNQVEEAKVAFHQSLDLSTTNAIAHLYLGNLSYEANEYPAAMQHYTAALPLDPENQVFLKNRLDMINDEARVESSSRFRKHRDPKGRFLIQHVEYSNGVTVPELMGILNDAYESIGKDLGIYPARTVNVKLYDAKDFATISKLPEWAIGIFDGKMRLKVDEVQNAPSQVRDLLFHEYTHAVVAMNVKQKVPAWFHEGLAQLMEPQFKENPREQAQMREALARNKVDFESLTNSFKDIENKGDAENAYLLSKYFLAYLNRKYGHEKLTEWVKRMANDEAFEESFRAVYGVGMRDAQTAWIKQVKG